MADIFGGVQPPAWLERLTTPSEPGMLGKIFGELVGGVADSAEIAIDKATQKQEQGINTNWIKELPGSIKPGLAEARLNVTNPLWKMQAQQAQLNMVEQGLRIRNEQSLIDSRRTKLRMQEHDQDVLPKWLQDHPTWETRQDAEPPVLYTSEGQRMFRDIQLGDSGNIKHKAIVEGVTAFTKEVGELSKLDPVAAVPFAAQIGKPPSPQLQAQLGDAMAKAKEKAQAAQAPIPMDVEVGGKVVHGYMQKGKFTQVKPEGEPPKPMSITLEDGRVVQGYMDTKGNFKEVKPDKPSAAQKLTEQQKSELTYARNRVQGLEKAMLDPANKNRMGDLRNEWFEARKYYNRLLKDSGAQPTPATAAPSPAPPPAAGVASARDPLGLFAHPLPQDEPPAPMIEPQ